MAGAPEAFVRLRGKIPSTPLWFMCLLKRQGPLKSATRTGYLNNCTGYKYGKTFCSIPPCDAGS